MEVLVATSPDLSHRALSEPLLELVPLENNVPCSDFHGVPDGV
jgi:hypothetical protein